MGLVKHHVKVSQPLLHPSVEEGWRTCSTFSWHILWLHDSCHAFSLQHWQQVANMAAARGMLRNSTHSTFSKTRTFHARADQLSRRLAITCNAQAEDVLLRRCVCGGGCARWLGDIYVGSIARI